MALLNMGGFNKTPEERLASLETYGKDLVPLIQAYNWIKGNINRTLNETPTETLTNLADLFIEQYTPKADLSNAGNFIIGSPALVGQISKLYHGSPYKFSKFADEKIGTGEGAQAFGYGHYLTDDKLIANKYARDLSNARTRGAIDYNAIPKRAEELVDFLENKGGSLKIGNDVVTKDSFKSFHDVGGRFRERLDVMKSWMEDYAREEQRSGMMFRPNMYTTTVNKGKPSSADVFLEWDKPVGKNYYEKVKNGIDNLMSAEEKDAFEYTLSNSIMGRLDKLGENITGNQLYRTLESSIGKKRASEFLSSAGITGIKYPAGTLSGVKNSKATNYVIFDPENITIDKVD